MSARHGQLQARIESIEQFDLVVGALRGIAIRYAQQGREHLAGVSRYADTVTEGIAHALLLPEAGYTAAARPRKPPLLLLFCAEHGFAGPFSEHVLDVALQDATGGELLIIGRRGLREAEHRGVHAAWCAPMIAHPCAASALAERLARELLRRVGSGESTGAELVFTRPDAHFGLQVLRRSLLPLDLQRIGGRPPKHPVRVQLPAARLLARLADEYLRAELADAILNSFTAENLARVTAMSAARDGIETRLDELRLQALAARQEAITDELLELAAAALQAEA